MLSRLAVVLTNQLSSQVHGTSRSTFPAGGTQWIGTHCSWVLTPVRCSLLSYTHRPHLAPLRASTSKSPESKAPKKDFWCKTCQGCSQAPNACPTQHNFGQLGRENVQKPPPSNQPYPAHHAAAHHAGPAPRCRTHCSTTHPP